MSLTRSLPVNDKNFSGSSIISSRTKPYRDIDLSFEVKPGTANQDGSITRGDIYKKLDVASLFQAMKNLLLTNRGEKPFAPEFGSDLSKVLFDNLEDYGDQYVKQLIQSSIDAYEPRVIIEDIQIFEGGSQQITQNRRAAPQTDQYLLETLREVNSLTITIVFTIRNTQETFTFNTVLNRLR